MVFYASRPCLAQRRATWGASGAPLRQQQPPRFIEHVPRATSVALPQSIGSPVGTVRLEDFEETDLIFFFGQNVGSNSRGCCIRCRRREARRSIIAFNPLKERGSNASPIRNRRGNADAILHPDLDPVSSGEGGRRSRRHHRSLQGLFAADRHARAAGRQASGPRLHRRAHPRAGGVRAIL